MRLARLRMGRTNLGALPFTRSLSSGLWMKSACFDRNAVQALINGHVEHVGFIAYAELHIAGDTLPIFKKPVLVRRSCRQESQFLALTIHHHDSGARYAADDHVYISFLI